MRTTVLFICLFFTCLTSTAQLNEDQILKAESVMKSINGGDMINIINTLCKDEMGGRMTGSRGFNKAVTYASDLLSSWGLAPNGDRNSYFQKYPHPYSQVYKGTNAVLRFPDQRIKELTFPDEYVPGVNSDKGNQTAELIYVGYGIALPEYGFDELKGLDLKGKIVIVEDGNPYTGINAQMAAAFNKASQRNFKIDNLAARGVIGIVIPEVIINPNIKYVKKLLSCQMDEHVLAEIFAENGLKYDKQKKEISQQLKPASFKTGCYLTIKSNSKYFTKGVGKNILAYIRGTDPVLSNETIVLTAHLDHVGYSEQIPIPGANDNASGSALIMRVGKALSDTPFKLKRSVLILLLSGEETGLKGSSFYVDHPRSDLSKSIFFNFDMVGMGDNFLISGGENFPGIFRFFKDAAGKYFTRSISGSRRNSEGRPRTDGAMFYSKHLVAFDCALRGGNYGGFYHSPKDKPNLLRPDDMRDLARLTYISVLNMAMYDGNIIPDWN